MMMFVDKTHQFFLNPILLLKLHVFASLSHLIIVLLRPLKNGLGYQGESEPYTK